MREVKHSKFLKFLSENKLIIALAIFVLIVHIVYALLPVRFLWDESIYIGMGKYLFSGGTLGFWEAWRPIGLPLILGAFWKIGIDPVIIGKILGLAAYMASILLVYAIANKCKKGSGIYAFLLAAATPLLFRFSNAAITDVMAAALGLGALYLVFKEKYFWAGIVAGIAFLFRFPYGLIIPAIYFFLFLGLFEGKKKEKLFSRVKKNFMPTLTKGLIAFIGLILIIGPYLVFNYVKYENITKPFSDANYIMSDVGIELYNEAPSYYIFTLLKQNLALIFAAAFILFYFSDKKIRKNKIINVLLFSAVIFFAYFMYLIHKEERYILFLFPLIAIFGGVLISRLTDNIETKRGKKYRDRISWLIICLGILLFILTAIITFIKIDHKIPSETKFYNYFNNDEEGLLLATNPTYMSLTDKPVMFLASWHYSTGVYEQYKDKADYIAINTCDYFCEPGPVCDQDRNNFYNNVLNNTQVVFNETNGVCIYTIYKLK
ncbi:MAG: ArnT family glycosyltransferase [Candidatus Nanoarchaeia archaeon]